MQRHPWVFSGAIERIEGDVVDGDVVEVRDAGHNWLARGYVNRRSQIVARLLTWQQDEPVDREFWRRRLARAVAARQSLADDPDVTAYRLVHAESDYVPGLIVDRYGDWLAVQFLTLGVERRKDELLDLLVDLVDGVGLAPAVAHLIKSFWHGDIPRHLSVADSENNIAQRDPLQMAAPGIAAAEGGGFLVEDRVEGDTVEQVQYKRVAHLSLVEHFQVDGHIPGPDDRWIPVEVQTAVIRRFNKQAIALVIAVCRRERAQACDENGEQENRWNEYFKKNFKF